MAYTGKTHVSQTRGGGGGGGGLPPGKPPQSAKPAKPRKKVRWGRILLVLILFGSVMGLTGLAGYGWYLERKVVSPAANQAPLQKEQPVNVLIVGLDRDPGSGDSQRRAELNTDTLIVAHIDPATHKASFLSIPRDTRVELPTGFDKINAAYATGGMDELKRTVKDLTTLSIDRYVMIDFPAFVKAIDSVGGVEFNVDRSITDPEGTVSLQKGQQVLDGQQALALVRFRHEPLGDIARVQRQEAFLQALCQKMKAANLVEWMKGLRAMSETLQTDMTISEMGMLANALQDKQAKFDTQMVPGEFLDLYGVSYWKAHPDELKPIVQAMQ